MFGAVLQRTDPRYREQIPIQRADPNVRRTHQERYSPDARARQIPELKTPTCWAELCLLTSSRWPPRFWLRHDMERHAASVHPRVPKDMPGHVPQCKPSDAHCTKSRSAPRSAIADRSMASMPSALACGRSWVLRCIMVRRRCIGCLLPPSLKPKV